MRFDRFADQRGESLLESLLSIMVLSVVVASTFGGLQVAMRSSAEQRDQAAAGELLRNSAEVILDPDYEYVELAGCEDEDTYEGLPTEKRYPKVSVVVRFLDPGGERLGREKGEKSEKGEKGEKGEKSEKSEKEPGPGSCPEEDPGLQEITLSATTQSGHNQSLVILKARR